MYTRVATVPNNTFFLFGPRGTGKTTWLRTHLPNAAFFNLLHRETHISLAQNPAMFRQAVNAMPDGSWVVVDEVQRLPDLLDEVHDLHSLRGDAIKFALSGSSARKLRRSNVNLLAGRAITRHLYPLCWKELGADFNLAAALDRGTMPEVYTKPDLAYELLQAYVETYLEEEIRQEAAARSLGNFARFLKIAALLNGEQPVVANISREAGVARQTVDGYLAVLVETLIADWLPAWQPRAKIRERAQPKFYFFDCGLVRALTGRLGAPLHDVEKGKLLETLLLNEIKTARQSLGFGGELSFWQSERRAEVDLIWSKADVHVGIEIKSGVNWAPGSGRALKSLLADGILKKGVGVYGGTSHLKDGLLDVFPLNVFLELLWRGEICAS